MVESDPRTAISLHDFIVDKGDFKPVRSANAKYDDMQECGYEEKIGIFVTNYLGPDSTAASSEYFGRDFFLQFSGH